MILNFVCLYLIQWHAELKLQTTYLVTVIKYYSIVIIWGGNCGKGKWEGGVQKDRGNPYANKKCIVEIVKII